MNGASWSEAAAPVLVLTALLLVPGLLLGYLARARGFLLAGIAPGLGAGVWALASVAWSVLGLTWSVLAGVVVAVVLGAVIWALVRWLRPDGAPRRPARGRLAAVLAWSVFPAMAIATLVQLRRLTRSMGSADAVAQSYDTVFHLNAVAFILENGDASPLGMTMANPAGTGVFYPTLWHGLVALAVQLTGASIPLATNALVVVVMAVVWPLSVLALGRMIFGARPLHLGLTMMLAFTFPTFPNRFLSFGVLYPNLLANAMIPAALALVLLAVRSRVPGGRLPWLVPVGLGSIVFVGLGFAHPNGVIGFVLLAAFPLALRLLSWSRGQLRWGGEQAKRRVAITWALSAGGALLIVAADRFVPFLRAMRAQVPWSPSVGRGQALADLLAIAAPRSVPVGEPLTSGSPAPVLAALVLVGVVVALRTPAWRWLPLAYLAVGLLWIVAIAWDHPLRTPLTGYWYSDQVRIGGLLPVMGLPLAVLGVMGVLQLARLGWLAGRVRLIGVLTVAAVGIVFMGQLPATRQSFDEVAWMHGAPPELTEPDLLAQDEADFMDQVAQQVPEGEAVVTNAWDGGSLIWALDDVEVIYPSIRMAMDEPRLVISESLIDAGADPAVCDAVEALDAYWVLHLGPGLWRIEDPDSEAYQAAGTYGLEEAGVAEVVLEQDDMELLRVTACDG